MKVEYGSLSSGKEKRSDTILNSKHISTIFRKMLENNSRSYITVGEIKEELSNKAFGILMLVFALPNLIPLPIPGISTVLGTPLIVLSYQLVKGRDMPWFPKWLAERSIECVKLKKAILYILPYLERLEGLLKPRLSFLVDPPMERFIAVICLVMALIMTLPIPLGNWFPAVTICLFLLAIIERDGVIAILGFITAIISVALISTVLFALFKTILFFLENLFE